MAEWRNKTMTHALPWRADNYLCPSMERVVDWIPSLKSG